MDTTQVQQPKSGFTLPWSIATLIAGVGMVVLLVCLNASNKPSEGSTSRLEREIAEMDSAIASKQKDLSALRDAAKGPAAELKLREEKNKSEAERIAAREKRVDELVAKNREKINQVQKQIEDTKQAMEKEKKLLPAQETADEQQQAKLQTALTETQNALVSIVSPSGTIGTGFFFGGFKQPTIITTIEVAPADQELNIKLRNPENAGENEPFDGTAKLVYADKESGLAFLIFTPKEAFKSKTLSKKDIREVKRGEKVYAIATSVHGGGSFGDFSASSGTVSGVDIAKGSRKFMQLAMPTNTGAMGAPVLGADTNIVAIVAAKVEGMEKSVLAIPAVEIEKAIGRMIEMMKK